MSVTGLCVSVLLMAHLCCCFPVDTGTSSSTGTGTRTGTGPLLQLQELLDRLETLTDQRPEEPQRSQEVPEEDPADTDLSRDQLDEALIRELLSAKNLKTVRNNNNSNRGSSGCFNRRMDRIGSMSSLGCNTVGRNSPKSA
ncbi:hypothetical protein WMY93_027598 [Mugilogobius chulae]|uniref:B-type natriuretic peptide n=1 Tax=Mugilogobius chulae TaxID=88201 RepID=A0AAW0MXK5_9GOBI